MRVSPVISSKSFTLGDPNSDLASSFQLLARISASVGSFSGLGFSAGGAGGFAFGYQNRHDPAVASDMSISGFGAGTH